MASALRVNGSMVEYGLFVAISGVAEVPLPATAPRRVDEQLATPQMDGLRHNLG